MLDYIVEEELIAEFESSSDTMKRQQLKRLEFQEREREREAQLKM